MVPLLWQLKFFPRDAASGEGERGGMTGETRDLCRTTTTALSSDYSSPQQHLYDHVEMKLTCNAIFMTMNVWSSMHRVLPVWFSVYSSTQQYRVLELIVFPRVYKHMKIHQHTDLRAWSTTIVVKTLENKAAVVSYKELYAFSTILICTWYLTCRRALAGAAAWLSNRNQSCSRRSAMYCTCTCPYVGDPFEEADTAVSSWLIH